MRPIGVIAAATLLLAIASLRLEADDPVSSNVSFNREVIRIIQRKCEPCHSSEGLAMSLSDYREARSWGRAIREELVEHRMPPAMMARGFHRYESDPSLNQREIATFLTWLDGGMPRGDEADRPRPLPLDVATEIAQGAGIRLPLPPQQDPAGQDLVIRRVTMDAAAVAGHAIARVQLRPGNRRVLRGALVFAGSDLRWIGVWMPWQHVIAPPATHAFRLAAGAPLVVELFYRGADVEMSDRSEIDVTFAPAAGTGEIDDLVLDAREAAGHRARATLTLSRPTTIWAIQPVSNPSVTSMEVRAERPDKSFDVLLWIPQARADWPLGLVLEEPVTLPAGSTVSFVVETSGQEKAESPPRVTLSVLK